MATCKKLIKENSLGYVVGVLNSRHNYLDDLLEKLNRTGNAKGIFPSDRRGIKNILTNLIRRGEDFDEKFYKCNVQKGKSARCTYKLKYCYDIGMKNHVLMLHQDANNPRIFYPMDIVRKELCIGTAALFKRIGL